MNCAQAHHGVATLHFGGLLCEKLIRESIPSILDRILIVNFSVVTSSYPYFLRNTMQRINEYLPSLRALIATIFEITVDLGIPGSLSLLFLGTMRHHQYAWCHPKLIRTFVSLTLRAKWQSTNAKPNWWSWGSWATWGPHCVFIYVFIYLSIYLCIHLLIYSFICSFIYLYIYVYVFV